MAYDLINGDTPVNWARGTEKLLPHTPTSTSMGRDSRKRLHHLRKIVRRAARGDTNAFAQMQQVQQRLSQRAAYGDARATALLQKITVWYAADRAQYQGSSPAIQPSWSPMVQPPGAPPVIPPSSTDVYYPATSFPTTPPGSSDDYDDESGSLHRIPHGSFYNPKTGWHTFGSLNDDERAVARDGGPSERAALTRMRSMGLSGVGPQAWAARQQAYQRLQQLQQKTRKHF